MTTTTTEKFDIACIGFKRMGNTSKRMYYYKLNRNGKEYLLVNAGMIRLLHMQWTEKNEFVNSDLWDDFERPFPIIEDQIGDAVKIVYRSIRSYWKMKRRLILFSTWHNS